MATEKRLIDANELMSAIKSFRWLGVPNTLKLMFDYLKIIIREQPTVDAVILPKGKPGDYVLWTNGVSERLFEIENIMICRDGMRYDLGYIYPFVNHSHILRIMNREEAERWIENAKREATD